MSRENEGATVGEGETPDRTRGGCDVDSCDLNEESTGERTLPGLGPLVIMPCRGEVADVPLALLGLVSAAPYVRFRVFASFFKSPKSPIPPTFGWLVMAWFDIFLWNLRQAVKRRLFLHGQDRGKKWVDII